MKLFTKNKQKILEGFDNRKIVKIENKNNHCRKYDFKSLLKEKKGKDGSQTYFFLLFM